MQQGSYLLIEKGMAVHGVDSDLGTVTDIIADEGADIFRGIVVSRGLLASHAKLIPAENIVSVVGSTVTVNLTTSAMDSLPLLSDSAT